MRISKKYFKILFIISTTVCVFFRFQSSALADIDKEKDTITDKEISAYYESGLKLFLLKKYPTSKHYFEKVYFVDKNYKKIENLYRESLEKSGDIYIDQGQYLKALEQYEEYLSYFDSKEVRIKYYFSSLMSRGSVNSLNEGDLLSVPENFDVKKYLKNEADEKLADIAGKNKEAKKIIYNYFEFKNKSKYNYLKTFLVFLVISFLFIIAILFIHASRRLKKIINIKEIYDGKSILPHVDIQTVKETGTKIINAVPIHSKTLSMRRVYKIGKAIDKITERPGHNIQVGDCAYRIAEKINSEDINPEEIQKIGFIHDLGYIRLAKKLRKEGRTLSDADFDEIKEHIVYGVEVLKKFDVSEMYYDGLKYHHERCDGSGYPEGLKANEIPMCAKIIAVADFFVSVTSSTERRAAVSHESAIAALKRLSGKHYDKEIVEVLEKIYS